MKHNHGAKKIAAVATSAGLSTRIVNGAAKHPLLVFSLGVLAGFYLHKNRQQIIDTQKPAED